MWVVSVKGARGPFRTVRLGSLRVVPARAGMRVGPNVELDQHGGLFRIARLAVFPYLQKLAHEDAAPSLGRIARLETRGAEVALASEAGGTKDDPATSEETRPRKDALRFEGVRT